MTRDLLRTSDVGQDLEEVSVGTVERFFNAEAA